MSIVIVSYRQEWEHRCARSCNCLHASGSSDFEMHLADNEEAAASYIATRIHKDQNAAYLHYLFDSWEDVVSLARVGSHGKSPVGGVNSIVVAYTEPEDYEGGYAEYDKYEAEQKRKERMGGNVSTLVKNKLDALNEATQRKQNEARQRQIDEEKRKQEEAKRKQYEQLKQEFEGKPHAT